MTTNAASAVGAAVPYIPPFDVIKNATNISAVKGELCVTISYGDLINIVKQLLVGITVDEAWYVRQYEDVAHAISAGEFRSARAHFVEHGYIEGRLPGPIAVDEHWYLDQYPDVAESVRQGNEPSAQAHFDRDGYREGRLPFPV